MKALIGFFIGRPLLVNLSMVFVYLAGYQLFSNQVFQSSPEMDLGSFFIDVARPGAGPEDMELSVTVPLEDEILKVDKLDSLVSTSMEGYSYLLITANPDNNPEENRQFKADLAQAIERAEARMPADLPRKPVLGEHDVTAVPIIEVLIYGDVSEDVLRRTARQLQTELRQLPGIAGVDREGYRQKEVRILLDPLRIHRLGMSYDEVIAAIKGRNVRDSGGSVDSFVAEQDILTVGQFDDPKDVQNVIIRGAGKGNYVRVRDVARVVADYEEWSVRSYVYGQHGISLLPRKHNDVSGITLARQIREHLARAEQRLPQGVELAIVADDSQETISMLRLLAGNAWAGLVLVILVLLAFFPVRFSLWVAAGVPTAIMIAFILMPMLGLTINQMTLSAIILMLGLLVDDAVVISESIFRHYEAGESPLDAAINGTTAVSAPVLASIATTMIAFLPAAFMGGAEGKFMWVLPAMVLLVLSGSLIECKLLLPSHMYHALGGSSNPKVHQRLSRQWFNQVEGGYHAAVEFLLRHRYIGFAAMTILFTAITVLSIRAVDINFYEQVDADEIYVRLEMPAGSSAEATYAAVMLLEARIREMVKPEELVNVVSTIGNNDFRITDLSRGQSDTLSLLTVYLVPLAERETGGEVYAEGIRQMLKEMPGFKKTSVHLFQQGPPVGHPVELYISGSDERGFELADMLIGFLEQQPGVTRAWSDYNPGKDKIELVLNHEAIADYGLQVADITRAVRIAFDGQLIDEIQTSDERIKYRLQFQSPEQGKLETLYALSLINTRGEAVLLRSLVEFRTGPGQANINRRFGERTITVAADIDKDLVSVARINQVLGEFIDRHQLADKYRPLHIIQGGEMVSQQQTMGSVGIAFVLSISGILFLLVLLFNSVTQPLLVLAIVPMGIAGVLVAFALHGLDLTLTALVGILGLSGVLVNSSLLMVDTMNKARTGPYLSQEQVAASATLRLRPIFITTTTTVAGLFPAAYGLMGDNEVITPMIMAMLWGVFFGSWVTLFYLPCLYAIHQDIHRLCGRLYHKVVNLATS